MDLPPYHIKFSNETELVANLEDTLRFIALAKNSHRCWKWIVYALFSAVQSAMIMVRGEAAVELKPNLTDRRVKPFKQLYEELAIPANWEGLGLKDLPSSSRWDYGITILKNARDDIEHPKYDGTVYPCLTLKNSCMTVLAHLQHLVDTSPRLQERVGKDIAQIRVKLLEVKTQIQAMPVS